MRIGLISDIHGNLLALEVVLQELAQEQVDQIICLGDVGALGPQPRQVIERLRYLHCPVILGNTDAWLLTCVQLLLITVLFIDFQLSVQDVVWPARRSHLPSGPASDPSAPR